MIGQFFARILGLVGIFAGSQGPGYALQYLQNLNGRVDELRMIVAQYDGIVDSLGLSRGEYIEDLRQSGRESASKTADVIADSFARYERLSAHLIALQDADPLMRPIVLARTVDRSIAESTFEQFSLTLPLSPEGAAYALGGGAALWGGPAALFSLLGGMFGSRTRYA
ncbi:MAG: DUF2937 family protein [Alphaproteobacteria bacterium]|nr:DUF2937 family protein [Alphaproteobacteria bacterium]